ncbi:activating signal cointegrator 1 complex subunit 3 isoform X1 [Aricia agestis]|uniref:activating signal cointegrator 1 complex subunit 3 isoform X1 n=1 Tax=Aricia agestis TaxID=91739 RepID=UPI001C2053F9|nr:activating signal cointegrator 1 complex subunit 3 isoform X1 [Aricia agestis]XP_041983111.1 activating signal cointegrator 1 complex subunit 3 isoform X1 [Aricia agestis]
MIELPRITRALRAHTQLDKPRCLKPPTKPSNSAVNFPKNLQKFKSFNDIYNYIKENETDTKVLQLLKELKEACKLLTGDATDDVINDAAVLTLRMFLDQDIVMLKHLSQLRQTFGTVLSTTANKICEIVTKISSWISDETKEYIKSELIENKENVKLWGENIQIHYIPYKPQKKPLAKLTQKPATASSFVTDFSMKYEKRDAQKEIVPPPTNKPVSKYTKTWLETKVREEYKNSSGLSAVDILQSLITLLNSSRSNNEIQNDMFELLGFDKFEFIQEVLQNREDITYSLKGPPPQPTVAELAQLLPENKMPQYLCQVSVQSEQEKMIAKLVRKEEKKSKNKKIEEEDEPEINVAQLRAKRLAELTKPVVPFSTSKSNVDPILQKISYFQTKVQYPNVYDSTINAKNSAGFVSGTKLILPESAIRKDTKEYEEVIIPKNEPVLLEVGNQRVPISSMDEIGQMAFENIKELNRIQSIVYQTAYNTNENLLICAPTGAGKTNIALLTVVHQIKQHIENNVIMKNKFKIIYIAPMKALASEMTASFGRRLQGLGIAVRELTGDMKLTKSEVQATQMIVTTPEKWDVVTRKGATDTELASIVKLLIIDEVHLLHGDRGPIVEAIVARTLRQVETTQNMIRIVGLSATLPNYVDVARFLRVNPNIGLFFFDSRFRPVPLEQQFIGVKDVGSGGMAHIRQIQTMNEICYDKAADMVQKGHQVMVFVHARNATHQTAMVLKELAQKKGHLKYFEPEDSGGLTKAKKSISSSPNKQLAELFSAGFACHHAGMLRSDRNMVEKYFAEGYIKVLVCTSTLAWGVNLPAHAVVIRGTEIYDQSHGTFVDLSILDVLQIFGRAGRPQFDSSGTGIIITSHDKLTHYLKAMTNQFPIESNFINLLADNLNAEVALGTVTNIDEAVEWLSYTYLFVRMRINPQVYGLTYADVQEEPMLETKRRELITAAALQLDRTHMLRYDERTGNLNITDLGRTASHYYITCETMEVFNSMVRRSMTQGYVLEMLTRCSDFQQLKVRKEELTELWSLKDQYCELRIEDAPEDIHWKINILLQTYLSRGRVNASSLQSDLNYISQNAVRIVRALFEITLRKNNAYMAGLYLKMAKMMELQHWDFYSDMRQFNCFPIEVLQKIEYPMLKADQIRDMDVKEIGDLIRNPKAGRHLKKCADEFPLLEMEASLHPITRTVLRIRLTIIPNFRWSDKYHGKAPEAFWIWVEDPDTDIMYYHEYFLITKKQVITREPQELIITIPISEPLPPQYYIRATSERWLGSESVLPLTFQHLILPETHPPHTDLRELQPLPVTALNNPAYEMLYPFSHFNPIQTQIFHCLYHTDNNVLLGAPTGSGKTIVAEVAMFRVFNEYPGCKVVYIAPLKALVKERINDWKIRLEQKLGKNVVELTGDVTPDVRAIRSAHVIVSTPEKWDGVSRSWQTRGYVRDVALIVIDEIHLLGEDRGPVLEVIVSRTNFIQSHTSRRLRIIGLSTALANAKDLANWLNIGEMGLYNFRPSVRPVPLEVHISGHPGRHYCPRMLSMNKPTFHAIRTHSPCAPALVFVSSRRQTRLTALDLIAYLAAEENPKQWLHMQESEMEQILSNIRESNLKLTLAFGIGIHHAGLHEKDRTTVEELFINQKIQVLICTATLAWGVNFPAHLVVIKGTEYFDGKKKRYVDMPITDVLQMMGRAGRPQYDNEGVAVVLVHDQKKNFYKKFLYEPFPVESSLLEVLADHLNAEIVAGTVQTKQDILDYLTWTYFFRRLLKNPSYYNLESLEPQDVNYYLSNLVQSSLDALVNANCLEIEEDERTIHATWMGRIASYYYLSHRTMAHFAANLHYNLDTDTLLRVLSDADEYATLPVRHNEDVLNGELSQLCRLPVDSLSLDSSNVKAFLLLQAHMTRLPLPNTDYLTDTKSVLDQTIRIIQAMIDTSAENGWLSVCLSCQMLMQSLVQARWPTDSPLTTLPHIDSQHLCIFTQMARDSNRPCTSLNGLKVAWRSYESLAKYLRREFEESQIEQIYRVVCDLPTLDIRISIRGLWIDSDCEQDKVIRQPQSRDHWIPIHADQEYTLILELHRRGGNPNNAICPRFPRGKNEGWFATVGCVEQGELVALTRIPARGTAQLTVYSPSRPGRVIYTLYILSDSYMGLDQQYDLQFEVVEPLPEEKVDRVYDVEKVITE